jgi:hypothetical protein
VMILDQNVPFVHRPVHGGRWPAPLPPRRTGPVKWSDPPAPGPPRFFFSLSARTFFLPLRRRRPSGPPPVECLA